MKRIIMMLALTALLVVALSMSALSAFAANGFRTTTTNKNGNETNGNCNAQPQKCQTINRGNQVVVGQSER